MNIRDLEKKHVAEVYKSIAGHFSETRYKRWPVVQSFLDEQNASSLGVDLGCGNGKNVIRDRMLALDACPELLQTANSSFDNNNAASGMMAVVSDVRSLPLREACFDFAISIAVLHHLSTPESIVQALAEMKRILAPGGEFLIFVWACLERNKSARKGFVMEDGRPGDYLVPWTDHRTGIVHQRFYHLFEQGELDQLISRVPGITLTSSGYDKDNWYVLGTKNKT